MIEQVETKLTTWDYHYLNLCDYIAMKWSRDPSSKFGCVIADKDHQPVSWGVNGFAQGFEDSEERWNDRDFKYKHVIHSEENAILFSQRSLKDCILYCNGMPCSSCMSKIAQKKISTVICWEPTEDYLQRWSIEAPLKVAEECGVETIIVKRENSV